MFDIVTIGSAAVDFFVNKDFRVTHGEIRMPFGIKMLVKSSFFVGGSGVNTAIHFSRMGLRTGFLGVISNDSLGELIINRLRSEGVKFIGERVDGVSGYSIILLSKGDRTILINKGVNELLSVIPEFKSKWLYLSSMTGKSFRTQLRIVKDFSGSVAYNPSSYELSLSLSKVKSLIKRSRVLIFNKEEAEMITTNPSDLLSLGPEYVVVTNGSKLIKCYTKDGVRTIRPHKIKVVDTTGAGDAFAAGFVNGLINGFSVDKCLRLGLTRSELVIKHLGATR